MRIDANKTIWRPTQFGAANIGQTFWSNGNKWRKVSTRTAAIVYPKRFVDTWFYFGQTDVIETAINPIKDSTYE